VVVGSPLDDDFGNASGSAYFFHRPATGWTDSTEDSKVTPLDAPSVRLFGHAVALTGDTAVISEIADPGLVGAAYIFERVGAVWIQTAKFTASDAVNRDFFGASVTLVDDLALVGASCDITPGKAYVFEKPVGGWSDTTETARLTPSDGAPNDQFGSAVSIANDTAVVGAPADHHAGAVVGSVYLFDRPISGWTNATESLKIVSPVTMPPAPGSNFGRAVGAFGETFLVGGSGPVHEFDRMGTQWVESTRLAPSDTAFGFGSTVALFADTALVGASSDDDAGANSGSAFVFSLSACPGSSFCLGVGCPCGNDGLTTGCSNSTGAGALLSGTGSPSVASDDLVLTATGCPPDNTGLYFMGGSTFAPVFVGDGLACTGGIWRYLPGTVDGGGVFTRANPVAAAFPGAIGPGDTRCFQAWTRDVLCGPPPAPCASPCGNNSNLSNGYSVTFVP
jgi:hypothetical protein